MSTPILDLTTRAPSAPRRHAGGPEKQAERAASGTRAEAHSRSEAQASWQGAEAPSAKRCPFHALFGIDRAETPGKVSLTEGHADAALKRWSKDWQAALPQRSPEEKARLIREAVAATKELQTIANRREGTSHCPVLRGFQAKGTYATTQARFRVTPNLPKALQVGPFSPGAEYRAVARFSNASPTAQSDMISDQRAVAFRIVGADGKFQDITLTSGAATNHAKDAEEFIASIRASKEVAEGGLAGGKLSALAGLSKEIGIGGALKMLKASTKAKDVGLSLAANTFYSRAPFELGGYAVKMRLIPAEKVEPATRGEGADVLMQDFVARRREGAIRYKLQVQGFVDSDRTSMADHTKEWKSEWLTVGELSFPKLSGSEAQAREVESEVSNTLAMSPFNQWDQGVLEPLGDLNMIRKEVYYESAKNSGRSGAAARGCPFMRG